MTSIVTSSTPTLPAAAAPAPSSAPAEGTASGGVSIVDAAIAEVLGTSVIGGGADAPSSDPRSGIPEFVRQFLPSKDGGQVPSAADGVAQQHAPGKQGDVQMGWAWVSNCFPSQVPSQEPQLPPAPPMKEEPPAPPAKGELPPSKGEAPGKGEPPAPPMKGEPPAPPMKGEPPVKGEAPGKVDQVGPADRGSYTVKPGDYLSKIAPKYGLTWQQLYWANRDQIKHPDLIHPGQVLKIPDCDLKVPNFPYTPMFTGPAAPSKPPSKGKAPTEPPAPPKGTTPTEPPAPPKGKAPSEPPAPPKGKAPSEPPAPPKGKAPSEPPAPPKGKAPSEPPAPPKSTDGEPTPPPASGGSQPTPPPAPNTNGELPPALPG